MDADTKRYIEYLRTYVTFGESIDGNMALALCEETEQLDTKFEAVRKLAKHNPCLAYRLDPGDCSKYEDNTDHWCLACKLRAILERGKR